MYKNKKSTVNPKKNDDKCLSYAITAVLNIEQTESHQERISMLSLFLINTIGKNRFSII